MIIPITAPIVYLQRKQNIGINLLLFKMSIAEHESFSTGVLDISKCSKMKLAPLKRDICRKGSEFDYTHTIFHLLPSSQNSLQLPLKIPFMLTGCWKKRQPFFL